MHIDQFYVSNNLFILFHLIKTRLQVLALTQSHFIQFEIMNNKITLFYKALLIMKGHYFWIKFCLLRNININKN